MSEETKTTEPFVCWNGRIGSSDEIRIRPTAESFLYGYGCFETMGFEGGKIRFFPDHWERLIIAAEALGLSVPVQQGELLRLGVELGERNRCVAGIARLSLHLRGEETDWMLRVFPGGLLSGDEPLRVGVSRFPHPGESPVSRWKHNNYLLNLMAFREARQSGWDEAILMEGDCVVEATLSNFWLGRDGFLMTPPLESGALAGVIRSRLIRNAARVGVKVVEEPIRLEEVRKTDELYLSNAAMLVRPIASIDGIAFPVEKGNLQRLLDIIRME